MDKVLIIAGQTATGKTAFANEIANRFNGELISADSRMVYRGMDIVTGKDKHQINVPVWLYDLVKPDESFSVSIWRQEAIEAIEDISSRGKLPIVVGGTGLYLRSLVENLDAIHVPPDSNLRSQNLSISQLQAKLDPKILKKMNPSDRQNPRRLIRAIETKNFSNSSKTSRSEFDILAVTLFCAPQILKQRISVRVKQRISNGALSELADLTQKYRPDLPSFTACGYKTLLQSQNPDDWIRSEYQYARRQKVFFQKYFPQNSVEISDPSWRNQLLDIITLWLATQK